MLLIFLWAYYFIGFERLKAEGQLLGQAPIWLWLALFGLLPFNLGIEYLKIYWAIAQSKVKISAASLSLAFSRGIALRFFLPNKMGLSASVFAKVGVKEGSKTIVPLSIANAAQMSATVLFGCVAVGVNWSVIQKVTYQPNITSIIFFALILMLLLWLTLPTLRKWILNEFRKISKQFVAKIVVISLVRYAVFLLQFSIAASFFNPSYSLVFYLGVLPLVYLFTTFIPGTIAGSIGARESVMMVTFAFLGFESTGMIASSLLVWTVNLLVPAVLGGIVYGVESIKELQTG